MSNIIPTQQSRTPKKSSVRVIFSFEKEFMFGGPLEFGSALSLAKVRDLQKCDERFHRCLDTIIHWEMLGQQTELVRYYIADCQDVTQAKQVITALRLMEVGFTSAYLYQQEVSTYLWEPLLNLVSEMQKAKSLRTPVELQYLRLKLMAQHCVSGPLGSELLKVVAKSEASISRSIKGAVHILKSSVSEIEIN